MTKIGYRFINWALLFLAGFILYELDRDIDGMEGTIISERLKADGYENDCHFIDLDDSFVYVLIEKNDNLKIGDRIKIKCPNKCLANKSYPLQTVVLIIIVIACFVLALFRTIIATEYLSDYSYLKD